MAKAKEYIGESYTDSLGQQWRWDGKTYIRNFGASPMASIKRSWDQKIVPLAEQAGQALTNKGPIEGRGRKKSPKDEAINWFNAVIEDPSLSDQVRTSLIQANFGMQNAFELEDTDTMTWAQSIAMKNGNQDLTENISKVEKENKKTEVENKEKVESEFELKGGPLKSEAQAREEWLNKTRNSPAQQSGAFTEQELWDRSKESGANKGREFAEAIKKPEVKSEGLLNKMKKR
tara:strand:- start:44 stop:739 length:696 start_codon:yes stop_codon:yes gene_type:complete